MQLISAIKMRRAQQSAIDGKPYQEFLIQGISRLTQRIDTRISSLLKQQEDKNQKRLAIFVSSNKGLCGGFNINLIRLALKTADFRKTEFITLGKKGVSLIGHLGGKVIADYSSSAPLDNISAVFSHALQLYLNESYSKLSIFYNKFISTLRHDPVEDILLPVQLEEKEEKAKYLVEDYIIEPKPEEIVDTLLKNYIEERIRFAIIESEAGEHSARMIAMKNATDNATDVVYNLTLLRNKLRQQKITYELLDMITAKQSVEV